MAMRLGHMDTCPRYIASIHAATCTCEGESTMKGRNPYSAAVGRNDFQICNILRFFARLT
eukprot:scaffold146882_cov19-Prasinocladus_malaysianus.AAC.1